jgi:hypothetical protein
MLESASEENSNKKGRPKGSKNKPKRGRPKKSKKPLKPTLVAPKKQIFNDSLLKEEEVLNSLLDEKKLTEPGLNQNINFEPIDNSFYYRGSKNVPIAGAQFEFTTEMILELQKCKTDILYFAENYFYIVDLDVGKQNIILYEALKYMLLKMG